MHWKIVRERWVNLAAKIQSTNRPHTYFMGQSVYYTSLTWLAFPHSRPKHYSMDNANWTSRLFPIFPHLTIYKQNCLDKTKWGITSIITFSVKWVVIININPYSKVHGANMEPTWVLSAPDGPHVSPMNLVVREIHNYIALSNLDGCR